jgi:putative salt-induced outer membrane protein
MKTSPKTYLALSLSLFIAGTAFSEDQPKPADPPPPQWKSSLAFGLTLTRGNSETFMATLTAGTTKKWDKNEIILSADGAYGKSKDQNTGLTSETAASAHGAAQYNRLFTERWYGWARVDGLYDGVADIDYRVTLGIGPGYYLIKTTNTDLSIEVGPGYVFEKLGGVEDDFPTLRVAEKFHHALSEHSRIWESAEWLPSLEDFSHYIINAEVGIEADLTKDKRWVLRAYLQDTYNSVPAAGRENNDMKLIAALGYKF